MTSTSWAKYGRLTEAIRPNGRQLIGSSRGDGFTQDWTLDGLGNWASYDNDGSSQTRTHDAANELTAASGWATPAYDLAGNMTSVPKTSNPATAFTLTYDAWNRLSEVRDGATLVGRYTYDATGRRVVKQSGTTFEHFFLEGQQVIETRDAALSSTQPESLNPTYQFVWSPRYIDSPILRDTYSGLPGDFRGHVT